MAFKAWAPRAARHWPSFLLFALLLVLAGCAQPGRKIAQGADAVAFWSGRMAVRVEGAEPQSFSAGFELEGEAAQGRLRLLSPIGSTLALIHWTESGAQVQSGRDIRHYASLERLLEESTGAPIPLRTLFDWLAGTKTELAGWRADLSELALGRLQAERQEPLPSVHLRLVLDPGSVRAP